MATLSRAQNRLDIHFSVNEDGLVGGLLLAVPYMLLLLLLSVHRNYFRRNYFFFFQLNHQSDHTQRRRTLSFTSERTHTDRHRTAHTRTFHTSFDIPRHNNFCSIENPVKKNIHKCLRLELFFFCFATSLIFSSFE